VATTSLLYPRHERQWRVNNFWPCILEYQGTVWHYRFIIELSAALVSTNVCNQIVIMSQNERQQSVNRASTILDLASCMNSQQWNEDNPQWTFRQPSLAKVLGMISHPLCTIECLRSVHNVCGFSEHYTAMNYIVLFLNRVLHGQSLHSVIVYNFPNMHAMSYRSDVFACSCKVNI